MAESAPVCLTGVLSSMVYYSWADMSRQPLICHDSHCDESILLSMHLVSVVSASSDTTVKVWNAHKSTCVATLSMHKVWPTAPCSQSLQYLSIVQVTALKQLF